MQVTRDLTWGFQYRNYSLLIPFWSGLVWSGRIRWRVRGARMMWGWSAQCSVTGLDLREAAQLKRPARVYLCFQSVCFAGERVIVLQVSILKSRVALRLWLFHHSHSCHRDFYNTYITVIINAILCALFSDLLHLVDIICCCAILMPIVWSIRHLR